jgi:hypothetical protein
VRLLLIAVSLAACAPDLRDDHPFDGARVGDFLENAEQPDGTTLSTIDATGKESWVYVDLDAAKVVSVSDGWELTFQRFTIMVNGGTSGPGKVRVAVLKDQDFAAMTRAPADGYQQDGTAPVFNAVEGGWYVYDLGKHKLATREDLFYVVDSGEGAYWKLKMKSYYDEQGTAARMQFTWGKVQPP